MALAPASGVRLRVVMPLASVALIALAVTNTRSVAAPHGSHCYLLGDHDHVLTVVALDDFDPRTNETTLGPARTRKTDALAFQPGTGTLFGANISMDRAEAFLGTFNTQTGAFKPLPSPMGHGHGRLGTVTIFDVSGLAFDPTTGWLYATKILPGPGMPDVVVRLNPETGRLVPGAFAGDDYAVLHPLRRYPHLSDVDDIAFHPATGQMYGIVNYSHDGDRLVQIDKHTGALTDVGGFGIGEVEGLDFDPRGRLWATAGGDRDLPNRLYEVDPATGRTSAPRVLDNSANYEALACYTPTPSLRQNAGQRS